MMERQHEDEMEIDLRALFAVLTDKIVWIVLAAFICAAGAFLVTKCMITPVYTSSTSVYILSKQKSEATASYSDLQTSTLLAEDCSALVKTRAVAQAVIDRLNLDMEIEDVIGSIEVSNASSSGRVLTISVTHRDPAMARQMADACREIVSQTFIETMDLQAVNTVDEADLPQFPSNISTAKNTLIGFLAGAFICCAVVVVLFLLNDKVRTPEDVEKYLQISVLGVIPDTDEGMNTEELVNLKKRRNNRKNAAASSKKSAVRTANSNSRQK